MSDTLIKPEGSWPALITPFKEDDYIDFEGMRRLVDFQIENGSDGILFIGSTGESASLTIPEKKEIIKSMADYCKGKIPAIFGSTCPTTKQTVELAQFAEKNGADGVVLVVTPYIVPPQESVYEFVATVAKSVSIGVSVYNNPGRVTVNMNADTILRLAEIPNVVADKEAIPNVGQLADILRDANGNINVLCCDSPKFGIVLPVLALGGHGTANVAGNIIPKEMAELSRPWKTYEDVERSRKIYFEILPLLKAVYSPTNPIAIKAAVGLLDLPAGNPRLPLPTLKGEKLENLKEILTQYRLREKYNL